MSRRYNTHLLPPTSSPDYHAWKATGDDWGTHLQSPKEDAGVTEKKPTDTEPSKPEEVE